VGDTNFAVVGLEEALVGGGFGKERRRQPPSVSCATHG
jgi:hypothetical protein